MHMYEDVPKKVRELFRRRRSNNFVKAAKKSLEL